MPPPTHCVTGSPPPAGTCATLPASRGSSSFRARDARPRLRAECRPGGVARPARRARVVGDRARRCDARLAVRGPPRADPPRAGALGGSRLDRPSGVVAWCEPYRYADAWDLSREPTPMLVCLDQVTDPHNLGAVVRAAAGAGASGVVVPAHGSVRVTPAVCRASAGAVEHLPVAVVPNLARYVSEAKGPALGIRRSGGRRGDDLGDRPERRGCARLRLRGEGRAAARPACVRRDGADSASAVRRIAQRRCRGCRDRVRGAAPASGAD